MKYFSKNSLINVNKHVNIINKWKEQIDVSNKDIYFKINIMQNDYISTKTTVSMIHYHFVFCPRYRRKIFLIKGVEDMFKQLTINEYKRRNIQMS